MIISMYNYIMSKMRVKEINKTIEIFGDDEYPAQLVHLQAQKDMLQYEQEYWREEIKSNFALSILALCIIFAASYFITLYLT